REFIQQGDTLRYRILFPGHYDPAKKYPLVVFLHGSGARGNDNEKQLTNLPAVMTDTATRRLYPSFILVPQCPEKDQWVNFSGFPNSLKATDTPTTATRMTLSLIDHLNNSLNIDKERIYI